MTDTGPIPLRRRRTSVAAASRVAIGGMSLTVGFGVLAALALSAPATKTTASVQLDAGSPVTVPTTEPVTVGVTTPVEVPPQTPPTTIVIITHYVPADGGTGSARSSGGGTSTQSSSRSSSSASAGGASAPAAASSPAPAPAAASPAPAAAPKPTAPPVTSTKAS